MINKLQFWRRTALGHLVFGLLELGVTYGFISLSIDRGNLLYYLLSLIFLVGSLSNFTKVLKKLWIKTKRAS